MNLRKYHPSDCQKLADLFYDTVHSINAKDYSEEQVSAWASGHVDLQAWNESFLRNCTVVAVEKDSVIGFGDIDQTGCLDMLYVHKCYQGMGVATAICNELEINCKSDIMRTHASITAKPFFEGRKYKVIREQQVIRNGIVLTNYVMEKQV